MKAFVCKKYGSPNVLKEVELPKPTPKTDQILVKLITTSINSADMEILKGHPLIRLSSPFKPPNRILGSDISGVIESIGPDVTDFRVNDYVYGDTSESNFGAFAEYVCISQTALRMKPESISSIDAGVIPSAAVLAYQGLSGLEINSSHKILINGAGGGLGTFALQIAKAYGAEVTGVDNKYKLEKMKELGANHVIDYETTDFAEQGIKYDLILDCNGKRKMKIIRKSLKSDGHYVLVGGKVKTIFATLLGSRKKSKQKISILFAKYNNKEYLKKIQLLIEEGKVHPIIDKVYNLSDLKNACLYYQKGEFFGKILLKNDYNK